MKLRGNRGKNLFPRVAMIRDNPAWTQASNIRYWFGLRRRMQRLLLMLIDKWRRE
ncbi:hypothetical protein Csa_000582 [Cucumis sativus]|uniref:Uncharacterized protein n=1 Tax=Cucumis sativus TaxID=3659 RepID=A0A0A0KL92_CUCSA|nr:hypothetical protein Csa_000582 [Cucumis sativus]